MSIHTPADVHSGATSEEMVARAVALQPLLRQYAGYGDAHRRQPDEVIAAMTEAGLFGLLVPKRFGGQQANLRTLLNVTEALAEVDGSAAWVVSLGAVAGWLVGLASERARDEVFGEAPDPRIAGSINPTPAERVDGGLLVSGRWAYASGAPHATWAVVGALVPDDAGTPEVLLCLIPMAQLTVEDTWHTVGMRGTGSHHLAAEDVFIPDHRTIRLSDIAEGTSANGAAEVDDRPHTGSVLSLSILCPLLGLGRAALALATEKADAKPLHHTVYDRQADSVGVQLQLARAALALQTARLHAEHVVDELDAAAVRGIRPDYAARAQIRAQCGYAMTQALEAVNIAADLYGAGSFAEASPMQQVWRDANVIARHAGQNAAVGYEVLGKALLGLPERISPTV
ncbi:acyl-CoA dehydrogenase family protein [Mycobacterium hodleri]|uniref:acyl-CoA dehydrogenase family protein n=1 Tax=Mycolicibacterium hodleri TaxID=49897 RepID=UPI0021F2C972|nr:acyl-CoA dehydrogenase family protein [Mycolicibacterium hodleri]MCV7137258.1 acyl-CoA dehydrogenase family protein [Mycolicibacterium hodleri]